mgnify:CR=1 FL=1
MKTRENKVKQLAEKDAAKIKQCHKNLDFRAGIDSTEFFNTPQPDAVSIGGIALPSYQHMWNELRKLQEQITVNKGIIVVQSVVLVIVALLQLLR